MKFVQLNSTEPISDQQKYEFVIIKLCIENVCSQEWISSQKGPVFSLRDLLYGHISILRGGFSTLELPDFLNCIEKIVICFSMLCILLFGDSPSVGPSSYSPVTLWANPR